MCPNLERPCPSVLALLRFDPCINTSIPPSFLGIRAHFAASPLPRHTPQPSPSFAAHQMLILVINSRTAAPSHSPQHPPTRTTVNLKIFHRTIMLGPLPSGLSLPPTFLLATKARQKRGVSKYMRKIDTRDPYTSQRARSLHTQDPHNVRCSTLAGNQRSEKKEAQPRYRHRSTSFVAAALMKPPKPGPPSS